MKGRLIAKAVSIFSILLLLAGCKNSSNINNPDSLNGSGNIITEQRNVSECSGLQIINVGSVYLTQDTVQSIRISADDNIMDKVITREEQGILVVGLENGSYSNISLKFYVSLKSVNKLLIEGAGGIECSGPVTSGNLYCMINGAGKIQLKGEGESLNCIMNGAGSINAKDYNAKNCSAAVNGAGNCTVFVTGKLDASVNGAGRITYYGKPDELKVAVSGVGQIINGDN